MEDSNANDPNLVCPANVDLSPWWARKNYARDNTGHLKVRRMAGSGAAAKHPAPLDSTTGEEGKMRRFFSC